MLEEGHRIARGGLRERAVVLVLVVVVVTAAVVVYIVRMVKPKRVRLRAGVGKLTILELEADGGDLPPRVEPKELPPSASGGDAAALPGPSALRIDGERHGDLYADRHGEIRRR